MVLIPDGITQVLLISIRIDTESILTPLSTPYPLIFYSLYFSHLTLQFYSDRTLKMSSLYELDSSFRASTSVESTTTGTKWRSAAWKYYREPTKKENQTHLYCTHYTNSTKSPYYTSIAENIKKHLKGHHQIIIKKVLSKNQVAVNL
jgi:hypothetical protein